MSRGRLRGWKKTADHAGPSDRPAGLPSGSGGGASQGGRGSARARPPGRRQQQLAGGGHSHARGGRERRREAGCGRRNGGPKQPLETASAGVAANSGAPQAQEKLREERPSLSAGPEGALGARIVVARSARTEREGEPIRARAAEGAPSWSRRARDLRRRRSCTRDRGRRSSPPPQMAGLEGGRFPLSKQLPHRIPPAAPQRLPPSHQKPPPRRPARRLR